MSFTKQIPEWNAAGVEPPQSLKDSGWSPDDRPPSEYWNWQMNLTYLALKELQDLAETKGHASKHATGGSDPIAPSDIGGEPAITKNTAFNKNFGTSAGTVAEGNHSHTPGDVGAEPAFTKNTGFNKDFGTTAGTVAEGNYAKQIKDDLATHQANDTIHVTQDDKDNWNSKATSGEVQEAETSAKDYTDKFKNVEYLGYKEKNESDPPTSYPHGVSHTLSYDWVGINGDEDQFRGILTYRLYPSASSTYQYAYEYDTDDIPDSGKTWVRHGIKDTDEWTDWQPLPFQKVGDYIFPYGMDVIFQGGAGAAKFKANSADHVFQEFYAREAEPDNRSGYMGYTSGGSATFVLNNEIGEIEFRDTEAGTVTLNDLKSSLDSLKSSSGDLATEIINKGGALEDDDSNGIHTEKELVNGVKSISSQLIQSFENGADATGGSGTTYFSFNSDNEAVIEVDAEGNAYETGVSKLSQDLTNVSTIKIKYDYYRDSDSDGGYIYLVADTDKNGGYTTYTVRAIESYSHSGWVYDQTLKIDVSSLSGKYYVRAHVRNSGGQRHVRKAVINQLALIP